MTVSLNHTIVPATDKRASAEFLAQILGLSTGDPVGPFVPVLVPNGITLDYLDTKSVAQHHYAFLVDESDFDPIFERIQASGVAYYADPGREQSGVINHRYGGRGVYFDDPDNHLMEVLTSAG